jgi:dCTP deaminase
MLLSDKRIKAALEDGHIFIDPYDERHLGTNSYDCRLGEWYYRAVDNKIVSLGAGDTSELWRGPFRSVDGIAIAPGETILAHTLETVGGRNGYLAKMQARSTVARYGLSICKCAGVGDVGYISRWTMEISNHTHCTIVIPVGYRVAQMVFFHVGQTEREYHAKEFSGNYGRKWRPQDMLPQTLKMWDIEEMERIQEALKDAG